MGLFETWLRHRRSPDVEIIESLAKCLSELDKDFRQYKGAAEARMNRLEREINKLKGVHGA